MVRLAFGPKWHFGSEAECLPMDGEEQEHSEITLSGDILKDGDPESSPLLEWEYLPEQRLPSVGWCTHQEESNHVTATMLLRSALLKPPQCLTEAKAPQLACSNPHTPQRGRVRTAFNRVLIFIFQSLKVLACSSSFNFQAHQLC